MATAVTMPKLGLTMTEGTVSQWIKKEGDSLSKGDNLFVVSTDKITYEVQSEMDGTLLKIMVNENDSVPVGAEVAIIGEEGEIVESAPSASEKTPSPESKASVAETKKESIVINSGEIIRATPKARKTCKDNSIDLSDITGSGPEGRILYKDVLTYMDQNSSGKRKISPTAAKMAKDLGVDCSSIEGTGRIMKEDILKTMSAETEEQIPSDEIVPMTQMRKIIGERMLESTQTIPTVTYNMSFDCSGMMNLRNTVKESAKKAGAKVSYNDIIMMACAKVLKEQPMCNCSTDVENQCYILHKDVNIGLAVAVEGGLLVPNLKGTQNMSLQEIARGTDELVQKTRENRLLPEDMSGGTFTISNLGMFGMESFTPIVNPPESAILAINAIEDKPVVIEGNIEIRPMSILCLTADHRAVDGADAARFLARLKELLESPLLLLL